MAMGPYMCNTGDARDPRTCELFNVPLTTLYACAGPAPLRRLPAMFCCCCTAEEDTAEVRVHSVSVTEESAHNALNFERQPEEAEPKHIVPKSKDGDPPAPRPPLQPLLDESGERQQQEPDQLVPDRFDAHIEKSSCLQAIGWQVDTVDSRHLFLCRLTPGTSPLRKYNASAAPERQLREGDYIVDVNGNRESANEMMGQTRNLQDIKIVIQRPKLFTKKIEKHGGRFGVALTHAKGCPSLYIETIQEGALKRCAPEVVVGDRIVAVGGLKGDSEQLMQALMSDDAPEIQFSRAG